MTNNKIIYGLYGAGGFAREVMPLLKESVHLIKKNKPDFSHEIYFIETTPHSTEVNGYPLISEQQFFEMNCKERYFNIAIGDSKIREKIADRCISMNAKPMHIQAPSAIIYEENSIGEGSLLCANTMVTSNAKIGKFFHSNLYSYIAHDCIIGDYVTFAPRVSCNGNIHIHNHAYIGTGAVIKQGTSAKPLIIGEGAVVGMGAVVTKDVPPFTTVVGNPAKPLQK